MRKTLEGARRNSFSLGRRSSSLPQHWLDLDVYLVHTELKASRAVYQQRPRCQRTARSRVSRQIVWLRLVLPLSLPFVSREVGVFPQFSFRHGDLAYAA